MDWIILSAFMALLSLLLIAVIAHGQSRSVILNAKLDAVFAVVNLQRTLLLQEIVDLKAKVYSLQAKLDMAEFPKNAM